MSNYIHVIIFFMCCLTIATIMLIIPFLRARTIKEPDKKLQYECGFKPFNKKIKTIDIKFVLIAMLFIIFDVEIMILIPCALNIKCLSSQAMISVGSFLAILTVGFLYEWKKGLLEWI
jgi:NADH-quinone oxidoreductase subunit A